MIFLKKLPHIFGGIELNTYLCNVKKITIQNY